MGKKQETRRVLLIKAVDQVVASYEKLPPSSRAQMSEAVGYLEGVMYGLFNREFKRDAAD